MSDARRKEDYRNGYNTAIEAAAQYLDDECQYDCTTASEAFLLSRLAASIRKLAEREVDERA